MIYKKRLRKIRTKDEYFQKFKQENYKIALEYALDIRKFEINLYWKRATYFWAFIALTFTLYFLIKTSDILIVDDKNELEFVVSLLGLFLSLSWFLVNKGSKFWQENWEKQVDLLEDKVIGPLYKTTIYKAKKSHMFHPLKSYPFSVGKINQFISFVIIWVWIFLLCKAISGFWGISVPIKNFNFYIVSFAFVFMLWGVLCKTISSKNNGENINMKRREIEEQTIQ